MYTVPVTLSGIKAAKTTFARLTKRTSNTTKDLLDGLNYKMM